MCLRVKVGASSQPVLNEGISAKNGKPYSFIQQPVRLYEPGETESDKFVFSLPKDVSYYPPGQYIFDLDTHVSRASFDSLSLVRGQRLIPATQDNFNMILKRLLDTFPEFRSAGLKACVSAASAVPA